MLKIVQFMFRNHRDKNCAYSGVPKVRPVGKISAAPVWAHNLL